ncbi:MAG: SDR family oxidoreductase [Caldilineaceae bacterium]
MVPRHLTPERAAQWEAQQPLGRLDTPEDMALTTLFLASERSAWLTGFAVDIAGGRIMP